MAILCFPFIVVLLFSILAITCYSEFREIECDEMSQAEVEDFIGHSMGIDGAEIHNKLILADVLADRSFDKTWASSLTLKQYQDDNEFGDGDIVKENKHRFGYPYGETSGGYRTVPIPPAEPFHTLEMHSREVMQVTYEYMIQLTQRIKGFVDFFPEKPPLDGDDCPGRYHATHAELKLITRLMLQNELPKAKGVIIAVSRQMCDYCVPIMAYLARNGNRKVAVVAPRKNRKDLPRAIAQPEYILFDDDGRFTKYRRRTASAASKYDCKRFELVGDIPDGLDVYYPPGGKAVRQSVVSNKSCRQLVDECVEEIDGPGNECFSFIKADLPKVVDCPRPETITGVHGTFGPLDEKNPIKVLKSIGSFCDVTTKQPAMGPEGTIPFNLKCPEDYQLTGFYGSFGDAVNSLGIICRRISDLALWKSESVGSFPGGGEHQKECEEGAAGRQIRLCADTAINGLGLCCR